MSAVVNINVVISIFQESCSGRSTTMTSAVTVTRNPILLSKPPRRPTYQNWGEFQHSAKFLTFYIRLPSEIPEVPLTLVAQWVTISYIFGRILLTRIQRSSQSKPRRSLYEYTFHFRSAGTFLSVTEKPRPAGRPGSRRRNKPKVSSTVKPSSNSK